MKTKLKWVVVLKIWAVIYPSITIFLFLVGERLAQLALPLRTFILTALLVPWMVFGGIPLIDKLVGKWNAHFKKP